MQVEALVRGIVQGVGYRRWVCMQAEVLQITGWVRNERDGAVRVVLSGAPQDVERLVELLRVGPPGSEVREVQTHPRVSEEVFSNFSIQRSAT